MRTLPISLCCLLGLLSCTTQDFCDDEDHSELVARFKTIVADAVTDTIVSGVTLYGVREGQPDSLLYISVPVSRVILPLDLHHGYTQYVLRINDQSDTIRINHTTEFYLISYTCGFAPLFTIESLSNSGGLIGNMEVRNAVIDAELEQNEEHLWIYF